MRGKIKIEVSKEVRQKIEKMFGVTSKTVSNALNYTGERGQTELAKKIRRAAMENGGRRMACLPAFETIHDERGMMYQEFDNGCKIEVDKHSGDARLYDDDGKLRVEVKNISIKRLYVLQEQAMGI